MRARTLIACAAWTAIAIAPRDSLATPRFVRVDAPGSLGIGTSDLPGSGVALADLDDDGDDDLLVVQPNTGLSIDRSDGAGHLLAADANRPRPITARGDWLALSVAPSDLDGDGDLDLLLGATGGAYRLDAVNGTYVDRTPFAFDGLWRQTSSFALADVDGDGLLDVYVVTYVKGTDWPHNLCDRDALFLQREDEWVAVPLPDRDGGAGCGFGAVWFDHDGDGDVDPWVANDFGSFDAASHVWRNDGIDASGSLRIALNDAATARPIETYAMGVANGDLDGDGVLDAVSSSIGRAPMFTGDGHGHFRDVTEARGGGSSLGWNGTRVTWGVAILDLDGDGANDVLEAGGFLPLDSLLGALPGGSPTLFYGGATPGEEDASSFPAVTGEGEFRGIAVGDVDGDGAPDVAFAAAMETSPALLRNASRTDDAWLAVTARGTVSPREARGAIVTLVCADGTRRTSVIPTGGNAASFSAARAFVSTASCSAPSSLEVNWPSGCVSRHATPKPSASHHVTVEEPAWLTVDRTEFVAGVSGAANIVIDPALASLATGPHTVALRRIAGDITLDPVMQRADGTFAAAAHSGTAGDAWIEITIDGRVMPRHVRIHTRASLETTVHVVPSAVSPSRPVELAIVPRAIDGSNLGAGRNVRVQIDGGSSTTADDRGDGFYVARIALPTPAPSGNAVSAHVLLDDGRSFPVTIPIVADIDATTSHLTLSPGTVLDGTHPAFVIAKIAPVTPLGDPFPVRLEDALHIADENGATVGRLGSTGPASIAFTLDPAEITGHDLRLRLGAVDASNTARLQIAPDLDAVVARIDIAGTRFDPMQSVLQADGIDTTAFALHLVDADGNGLPFPTITWDVHAGTLVGGAGSAADGSAWWRVTAGREPGELVATVHAGSSQWSTTVPLVEPTASTASAVELCATAVSLPTGDAWLDVVVSPRRADRVLAGGARDVSLDVGGTSAALAPQFGSYVARVPIDRRVDAMLLHAVDRGTTIPSRAALPIDVTLALQTGPFVRDEPNATWHGENVCRLGGALVDGSDAGADSHDDASAPAVHAGGGCGCRTASRGRANGAMCTLFVSSVAVAIQRRKRRDRRVRDLF